MFYMISFGDFRKGKMVRGQNPIAKGLGICLFDFVYLFLDDFQHVFFHITQVQKQMVSKMVKMEQKGEMFHFNLMMNIYCKYFPENQDTTDSLQNCP